MLINNKPIWNDYISTFSVMLPLIVLTAFSKLY